MSRTGWCTDLCRRRPWGQEIQWRPSRPMGCSAPVEDAHVRQWSDEEVAAIDVFGPGVQLGIIGDSDGSLVVHPHLHGLGRAMAQLVEEAR